MYKHNYKHDAKASPGIFSRVCNRIMYIPFNKCAHKIQTYLFSPLISNRIMYDMRKKYLHNMQTYLFRPLISNRIIYDMRKNYLHNMLCSLTFLISLLNIKKFCKNQIQFLRATRALEMFGGVVALVFGFTCIYFFSVLLCCLSDSCYSYYVGGL